MTPGLDPKWPYTRRHRKLHLKLSAQEIREQYAAAIHKLQADAWSMPLDEVRKRIIALESDLARSRPSTGSG